MFKRGADDGELPFAARAALFGLAAEDEEVLFLLLEILDWKPTIVSRLDVSDLVGVHVLFAGCPSFHTAAATIDQLSIQRLVLVGDTDSSHVGPIQIAGRLSSPIDLASTEVLIGTISATFLVR